MICEPVFEDPGSLKSLVQRAEARLAARERVPDLELAMIVEGYRGKALPAEITDYLAQHFRGEIRGVKGPKLQSDAAKDFRFGPADNLYRRVLPIFEYLAERRKRLVLKRRNHGGRDHSAELQRRFAEESDRDEQHHPACRRIGRID